MNIVIGIAAVVTAAIAVLGWLLATSSKHADEEYDRMIREFLDRR